MILLRLPTFSGLAKAMSCPCHLMQLNAAGVQRISISTPTMFACWNVSIAFEELICVTEAKAFRTTFGSPRLACP